MKLDRGSRELHDNKDLMTGPKGNSEVCFPETLNIEVEEVEVAPLPMIFHRKVYPSIPCACNELKINMSTQSVKRRKNVKNEKIPAALGQK